MVYSIIVFGLGILGAMISVIHIEKKKKKMLKAQENHHLETINSKNPYLCDARDYILFD